MQKYEVYLIPHCLFSFLLPLLRDSVVLISLCSIDYFRDTGIPSFILRFLCGILSRVIASSFALTIHRRSKQRRHLCRRVSSSIIPAIPYGSFLLFPTHPMSRSLLHLLPLKSIEFIAALDEDLAVMENLAGRGIFGFLRNNLHIFIFIDCAGN